MNQPIFPLLNSTITMHTSSDDRAAIDYLGSSRVATASPCGARVILEGGQQVDARYALPLPYLAAAGDELLVVGGPSGHFIIGVIEGAGTTLLEMEGNVDLRARGGALRLGGDAGVYVNAPEFSVTTDKLRVVATSAIKSFTTLCQKVSGMLSERSARKHSIVDGSAYERSRSRQILSEETVTINGKQIHLG